MKKIRPDDQDFTTIEHIRDGLSAHTGSSKIDRDGIHETEWVSSERASEQRQSENKTPEDTELDAR